MENGNDNKRHSLDDIGEAMDFGENIGVLKGLFYAGLWCVIGGIVWGVKDLIKNRKEN